MVIMGITFLTPWILGLLVFLPFMWWLLRLTPPSPKRLRFSALFLLRDIEEGEKTPSKTPLWLLLLRMVLLALIIIALAEPVLNPQKSLGGRGSLLLVVDNGWAAADDWNNRQEKIEDIVSQAGRQGLEIHILTTAMDDNGEPIEVSNAMHGSEAQRVVAGLQPRSWPSDREAMLKALDNFYSDFTESARVYWFSDGIMEGDDGVYDEIYRSLQAFGTTTVIVDRDIFPMMIETPYIEGEDLVAPVFRVADGGDNAVFTVRALAEDGRVLAAEDGEFLAGEQLAEVRLALPAELRREVMRLTIEGEDNAGAVYLLDEIWRTRPVGVVTSGEDAESQPLLNDAHYLLRAMEDFTPLEEGSIEDFLGENDGIDSGFAMIVLADYGRFTLRQQEILTNFVENGGVLVRFAGPHMGMAGNEAGLIPVPLRIGERSLGGSLSWSEPQSLADMPDEGPLAGLVVPDDVTVERQILAEPSLELEDHVWARLEDDTPLVTGAAKGDGWLVLVHVTADPRWSNLALSGLYVDMLKRFMDLSLGVGENGNAAAMLDPFSSLDGFGRLAAPPIMAEPLNGLEFDDMMVSSLHPAGYYGKSDARRAFNLSDHIEMPRILGDLPVSIIEETYGTKEEISLKPRFLTYAMIIAMLDLLISLFMRGLLSGLGSRLKKLAGVAALVVVFAFSGAYNDNAMAMADETIDEALAIQLTSDIYLAYVETGDASVDRVSRMGLESLSEVLNRRTAIDAVGAIGVNPESDELVFFPIIYWPVIGEQPRLSDHAIRQLNEYMRRGGTILFDTRDQVYGEAATMGNGPGSRRLAEIAERLDLPEIERLPDGHVLTRSFYLLDDFPGRYDGGSLWVEAGDSINENDGVSAVIVTANDFAGAWAASEDGRPLFEAVPNGARQREMALRVGVNIIMYAFTGNYKLDQVHVDAILERLGQ